MSSLWLIVAGAGFVLSQTGAALLFKVMAGAAGWQKWFYFAAGNAVGFGCPIALAVALRFAKPNLVYAICYGGGFCALQVAAWFFFREPLSGVQWAGVGLVALGMGLLFVN